MSYKSFDAESNDKTNLTLKELGLLRGIENDSDQWEDGHDKMKGSLYHDEWDMVVYRGVMSSLATKGIIVISEPEKISMGIMANWVFVNPKYTIEDDGTFEINWNLFDSKQLKKEFPHMTIETTLKFLDSVPHAFNPSQKKSAESIDEDFWNHPPFHVRFHLGAGEHNGWFQIKNNNADGSVKKGDHSAIYFNPETTRLFIKDGKLHNNIELTKKIHKSLNDPLMNDMKTPSAWVHTPHRVKTIDEESWWEKDKDRIQFSPKFGIHWMINGKIVDDMTFEHIETIGKAFFVSDEQELSFPVKMEPLLAAESFEAQGDRIGKGLYCTGCGNGRLKLKWLDIYGQGRGEGRTPQQFAEMYCKYCENDYSSEWTICAGTEKDWVKYHGYEAESFNVEFNEWADQEMKSHGKNISFQDWSKDEGLKHGNSEITDWAQHEDESHDARYGAETYEDSWEKGVIRLAISGGCFSDEYAEWVERQIDGPSSTLNNPRYKKIIDKRWGLDAENWGGDPKGKLAMALAKAREEPTKPLNFEKLDGGRKKRSGILSDPFDESSLDSGEMKKVLLGIGLGIIGIIGYNKWK
jgi:hypothetical protein